MTFLENYIKIRKNLIKEAFKRFKYGKFEIYSKLKLKYLILSLSSIIVQFSLKYKIKPDNISFTYIILLISSFLFIISKNDFFIFIGLLIIFLNNSFDFADGHLSRLTGSSSTKGHLLDLWGGFLKVIIFQLTLYIFLFNQTSNIYFLYAAIFFLLLKSTDFKLFIKANYIENYKKNNNKKIDKVSTISLIKKSFLLKIIFNLFGFLYYDGRSKYTDFILFIYVVSIIQDNFILLIFISILWLILNLIIFIFKFLNIMKLNKELR
mgnify:CR=1 FL=1